MQYTPIDRSQEVVIGSGPIKFPSYQLIAAEDMAG